METGVGDDVLPVLRALADPNRLRLYLALRDKERCVRALMEAHLAECESCAEHLRQIRITVAVTGGIGEEDLDPAAREDLMEIYRRWRRDRPPSPDNCHSMAQDRESINRRRHRRIAIDGRRACASVSAIAL